MKDGPEDFVLSYSSEGIMETWETLHRFYSDIEAQLCANVLEANEIRYQLTNENTRSTLGLYGAMVRIGLQVLTGDIERARALLADHLRPGAAEEVEPAETDNPDQPHDVTDDAGNPIRLIAIGTFESAVDLREAALQLEAANFDAYLPRLVPRADRSPGVGRQFILRVPEDQADAARTALRSPVAEADANLRCPRCGAWNVFEITHELANLVLSLVGQAKPQECECLKCHYVGSRMEFIELSPLPPEPDQSKETGR